MQHDYDYSDIYISIENLIKKKFLEHNVLEEATFDIKSDVDFIWENGVKPTIEAYKNNPKDFYKASKKTDIKIYETESSNLPSEVSKKASEINPIYINVGMFVEGNSYHPAKKYITISINSDAVRALGKKGLASL
jgi:hypothetical protein